MPTCLREEVIRVAVPEEQHPDMVPLKWLSEEEGKTLFDSVAREYLHMSGEEFLRRWDSGEFDGDDRSEVIHVYMLIPLVRPD